MVEKLDAMAYTVASFFCQRKGAGSLVEEQA